MCPCVRSNPVREVLSKYGVLRGAIFSLLLRSGLGPAWPDAALKSPQARCCIPSSGLSCGIDDESIGDCSSE